jgi:hypothetical protein
MDYDRLLKQCKKEVANATSIEECFLIVHEYHEYIMQEQDRQLAEEYMEEEEDYIAFPV